MSKRNHKYLLLAVLAVSPFVALSPSKLIVKRTMASLEESATDVSAKDQESVKTSEEVKKSIESVVEERAEISEDSAKTADVDVATDLKEEAKAEEQPQVAEQAKEEKEEKADADKADKEEKKVRQCSAREEIENLEKEVEKVVSENLSLIEKFERLNSRYDDELKKTKTKAVKSELAKSGMDSTDMLILGLISMMMGQQQQQAPTYSYLPSAFSYAPQFTGPGWNYLPNHMMSRSPSSMGYSSWEQEYYNIPSLGFVNPALTPKEDSLTTGLYPAIYTSNGQGRALRSVHDIAPARGYNPAYLMPDATSNRQAQQDGFSFKIN